MATQMVSFNGQAASNTGLEGSKKKICMTAWPSLPQALLPVLGDQDAMSAAFHIKQIQTKRAHKLTDIAHKTIPQKKNPTMSVAEHCLSMMSLRLVKRVQACQKCPWRLTTVHCVWGIAAAKGTCSSISPCHHNSLATGWAT